MNLVNVVRKTHIVIPGALRCTETFCISVSILLIYIIFFLMSTTSVSII